MPYTGDGVPISADRVILRTIACAAARRLLGEHSTEILGGIGYSVEEIAHLRDARIV
jgi:crotonobetainyl-CoA:carnitine CoA-transferase CaiB-like acyl-CoA transferase